MFRKKVLALLLAAAMAVSLLAGCGGSKPLSQVIVGMLDGLYDNVAVEADNDLTAALKQAVAEGGTEEEILARMIEILNLTGNSITFTWLGDGQQGDHGVTLYFQTGTDPDAAARNALTQWASVLGTLPDDGSFQSDVAMIEAENGYYIALDVEVLKAGTPDKPAPDQDDNQDDNGADMVYNEASNSAVISGQNGLTSLLDTLKTVADENGESLAAVIGRTSITLTSDVTMPADWPYGSVDGIQYAATFDGGNHTISGLAIQNGSDDYAAMFAWLTGTVENVKFKDVAINGGSFNGVVAGYNVSGTVKNCQVLSGTVSGNQSVGALVGWNTGTITECESKATVESSEYYAGGIAGYNEGEITKCKSNAAVESSEYYAGGIAGYNTGNITECESTTAVESSKYYAGGIAGYNKGEISACKSAAAVTGSDQSTGGIAGYNKGSISGSTSTGNVDSSGAFVGGIAGVNAESGSISDCTASGDVTADQQEVGGIAGRNNGAIRNSSFTGAIVEGEYYVGGIVGSNTLSSNLTGTVIVEGCHSTGLVQSEGNYVGGIAGQNMSASVIACYSTAEVQSSGDNIGGVVGSNGQRYGSPISGVIDTCYATGKIEGGTSVGGVVGRNGHSNINEGIVNACYATGFVSGTAQVGGVAGSTHIGNQVTNCYWQNNASAGIGEDNTNGSRPSNEGATMVDGALTTWKDATDQMNQHSSSSTKFVYSGGAPTLPI